MHRRSFLIGLASSVFSTGVFATEDSQAVLPLPLLPPHVGTMHYFQGKLPPGWLLCDGRAVSRTYYAKLFDILGTSHGSGDGTTTFNLPNYWVSVKEPTAPLQIEEVPTHSHGFGEMQHHEISVTLARLAIYAGVE